MDGQMEQAEHSLKQVVAERKAQRERANRRLQTQKTRHEGRFRLSAENLDSLATVVQAAEANGLDGDEIAGALGAGRLHACFWTFGLLPGLAVNAACAFLNDRLIRQAYASRSIDGDSAAYLIAAIALPILFSAGVMTVLLGKGAKAAGTRGFWRIFAGYVLGAALIALAVLVLERAASTHLQVILYRA